MNKLILVPESMYNGLLTSNDFKNHTNLDYIKNKLENVRKNKKLKASAKNVLYNQELRRYLAFRHDEMEKPVKVELTGGMKYITKPTSKISLAADPSQTVGDDIQPVNTRNTPTGASNIPPPRQVTPRVLSRNSSYSSFQQPLPDDASVGGKTHPIFTGRRGVVPHRPPSSSASS